MNPLDIIYKYYPADDPLRRLLLKHSRQVAEKALAVCERHPDLQLDRHFLPRQRALSLARTSWRRTDA